MDNKRLRASGNFTEPMDDLFALLPIQPHQLVAVLDPQVPAQALLEPISVELDILGRPLKVWRKKPSLARRINTALAGGADERIH